MSDQPDELKLAQPADHILVAIRWGAESALDSDRAYRFGGHVYALLDDETLASLSTSREGAD
jgi:hypothetical protein